MKTVKIIQPDNLFRDHFDVQDEVVKVKFPPVASATLEDLDSLPPYYDMKYVKDAAGNIWQVYREKEPPKEVRITESDITYKFMVQNRGETSREALDQNPYGSDYFGGVLEVSGHALVENDTLKAEPSAESIIFAVGTALGKKLDTYFKSDSILFNDMNGEELKSESTYEDRDGKSYYTFTTRAYISLSQHRNDGSSMLADDADIILSRGDTLDVTELFGAVNSVPAYRVEEVL